MPGLTLWVNLAPAKQDAKRFAEALEAELRDQHHAGICKCRHVLNGLFSELRRLRPCRPIALRRAGNVRAVCRGRSPGPHAGEGRGPLGRLHNQP